MPVSLRTRAAYLRRMLKRMAEERKGLEQRAAQLPQAIARFLADANARHTEQLRHELQAVEEKIRDGQS